MSGTAFIRHVDNLPTLLREGIEASFYERDDEAYVSVPLAMSDRLNKVCLASDIEVIQLKQKGDRDDEPTEMFVIRIGVPECKAQWKRLVKVLVGFIVHDVQEAAKSIVPAKVMQGSANLAFDVLTDASALRTGLMRLAGKRKKKEAVFLLSLGP